MSEKGDSKRKTTTRICQSEKITQKNKILKVDRQKVRGK